MEKARFRKEDKVRSGASDGRSLERDAQSGGRERKKENIDLLPTGPATELRSGGRMGARGKG